MGLYYYVARWYDPQIAHFVQADTIVPSPLSSKSFDRFAYTMNNPIRYSDPYGHYYCESSTDCQFNTYHLYTEDQLLDEVFVDYGVSLTGEMGNWNTLHKYQVALGVTTDGRRLAGNMDSSAAKAFSGVYGYVEFEWNSQCKGCRSQATNDRCGDNFSGDCAAHGAYTISGHHIQFASMSNSIISGRNNVVHELGHAINRALGGDPYARTANALQNGSLPGRPNTTDYYGFAGPSFPWQQAVVDVNREWEIWADQFLGWVFDEWNISEGVISSEGLARKAWMTTNMAEFLK